jgi:RNA polymerase sigma-70 factor (ECF subfamily)
MEKTDVQFLFRQHYVKMLRVAQTILCDEHESKDVVSDIFASLLHGRIVVVPDTAERYLLTSVRNQCLKRIRHEKVKQQMEKNLVNDQDSDTNINDELITDIDEFVARYSTEQEKRIFYLRFSYGCSYEEIAAKEGISRVAVWKHLSHVLTLIRNHFKKQ